MIPRSFACLNDASLFKADEVAFLAEDDMIQKVNAQDLASLMQPLRYSLVFRAGFWIAAGVVVSYQDRGGVAEDRRLVDLSRMHEAAVEDAHRDGGDPDNPVLAVEQDHHEMLPIGPLQVLCKELSGHCGSGDHGPLRQAKRSLSDQLAAVDGNLVAEAHL